MSAGKREQENRTETYARALIEAARAEGRLNADLVQWQHAKKFSPEVLETLGAMQEKNDFDLITEVGDQYREFLDKNDSTVSVIVTTAIPLDDELREKVNEGLHSLFKTSIFLMERVNPSIIGGIIIESRGRRYDASIRAQLLNIRSKLTSNYVESERQ